MISIDFKFPVLINNGSGVIKVGRSLQPVQDFGRGNVYLWKVLGNPKLEHGN
jgi:hypothetical protein